MSDLQSLLSKIPNGNAISRDLFVPHAPGFRRVWYCTNRAIHNQLSLDPARFSNELGDLTYGLCQVRISSNRLNGQMYLKEWSILSGLKKTPLVKFANDYLYSSKEILLKLCQVYERIQRRQSLLFIHGFNVSFINAIERAAQLAEDLYLSGEVFVFSWPSQGGILDYIADQDRAGKSINDLITWKQIILAAMNNNNDHTLNVVAHSMGNRILAPAVEKLSNLSATKPLLSEVFFVAADADIDEMSTWLDKAVHCGRRITIYASSSDHALEFSERLHKSNRFGANPCSDHRWDTIHCNGCGDDWIKHSYLFESPAVLRDIRAALDGMICSERHLLRLSGQRTWKLLIK